MRSRWSKRPETLRRHLPESESPVLSSPPLRSRAESWPNPATLCENFRQGLTGRPWLKTPGALGGS
jgi:hypothetical protein